MDRGTSCPACGEPALAPWRLATATDPQLAGRRHYELARCGRCGSAVTLGPPPPPAVYEGGTYGSAQGAAASLVAPLRALAERDRLRFVAGLQPGARVLEVGAGDGALVAAMLGAGLEARGIDPSPAACEAARERGVEVANATVEAAEMAPGGEDAVVLWHALEHFERPGDALSRIAGWVRPGGRVIVAVPNLAGLQARIGGDRWFHQDVPRHRTHFTPAGLRALLGRCGFVAERERHLLVEQNPLGMWQTLLNLICGERNFAFRLLKRDLAGIGRAALARDALLTAVAALPVAALTLVAEPLAGLARRGGSIVVEARLR